MGFPCLGGKILAVLGAGYPKMWILTTLYPKRHVYQRNHVVWCIIHDRRKLCLTCRLDGEKRVRTKSQKFDKRPPSGGATPQPTPKMFVSIECAPQRGHPCQIWSWSVDSFLFHREVEIACFLYLAERPIQQCFALSCSAVIKKSYLSADVTSYISNITVRSTIAK